MTTDDSLQDNTNNPIKDPPLTDSSVDANDVASEVTLDNNILDFMDADLAIELYQTLANGALPQLDWPFYGRRKPNEVSESDSKNQCDANDGMSFEDQHDRDDDKSLFDNTPFDFDETFSELQAETSVINDSLQLKKRPEPGSERKTNLSDIMSDILKETSHTETE